MSAATTKRPSAATTAAANGVATPKVAVDAPKTAAAVAVAEVDGETRDFEFEGIMLIIPAELPPSLMFDLIEAEADDGATSSYMLDLRMLRQIVGGEQFLLLRNRIGNEPPKVSELITKLLAEYGLSAGESPASPDS